VGDTSDNIPGVPGIGAKTATALITRFGGIEEILQHLDQVTPPRARAALEANADQAIESKGLATIVRDLDVTCDLDHSTIQNFDRDRVAELFRELEFRTPLNRLPEPRTVVTAAPKVDRQPSSRTIVRTSEGLARLVERIGETREYAIDVESTSTDPMLAQLVG